MNRQLCLHCLSPNEELPLSIPRNLLYFRRFGLVELIFQEKSCCQVAHSVSENITEMLPTAPRHQTSSPNDILDNLVANIKKSIKEK